MFLVMGIQDKVKVKKYSIDFPCHICEGPQGYELIVKYTYFHLFFLPIWTWGHDYSLKCSACGSFYSIKTESQGKCKNEPPNLTYWDLEPVRMESKMAKVLKCSQCGYDLDVEFEFCPKCGKKT